MRVRNMVFPHSDTKLLSDHNFRQKFDNQAKNLQLANSKSKLKLRFLFRSDYLSLGLELE